jgi:hypothetical protein
MTLGETRGETREVDREAREAASALDPAPATPAAAVPPAGPSTKPKPLDAAARFDGPGVPYEHKFSTVSRGAVGVATLDGTVAADLVCWEYFYGKPCASEAERAGPEEDAARLEPWKSYVDDARPRPVDGVRASATPPPSSMPSPSCDLCHAIGTADDVCRGRVREALGQVRPKKGVRARLGSAADDADAADAADAARARRRDVVCRYGPRCDRAHPSDAEVRAKIEAWYVNTERWSVRKNKNANALTDEKLSGREGPARERDPERDPTRSPTWSVLGAGASNFRLRDAGPRAARTSAGVSAEKRGFSVSVSPQLSEHDADADAGIPKEKDSSEEEDARALASARVRRRLAQKAQTSKYVAAFLAEPFFDAILNGDPAFVRVLSHKSAHKEITEAYGARRKIFETLRGLGYFDGEYEKKNENARGEDGDDGYEVRDSGAGVTIFDACSGRGVVGVLLGYFFPSAKVVMLDANGSMDLSHVAAKDNVRFEHCDLYGDSAVRAIRETIEDEDRSDQKTFGPKKRRYRVLLGMHLCGALSPRLIDLAFGLDEVDGLVLCPCCVKGGLGGDCRRAAKQRNVSPYVVLCETFRRLCEEETERRDEKRNEAEAFARKKRVVARADENVLSPVNGFICVAKSGPGMKNADA